MAFDPRTLIPLVATGLQPQGGGGFLKGWQRAMQEAEQRRQQDEQRTVQQEELGFRRDANARATAASEREAQQQQINAVNSIRQLLEDPTIDDPAIFDQRMQFANQFAPKLGVDPGFIQSLRPAPTVFQQREARAKLKEIAGQYSAEQMKMLEADDQTGSAPLFTMKNGEKLTVAQLRERVGTQPVSAAGQAVAMRPPVSRPDVPNTTEEAHIADAIAIAEEAKGQPLTRGERAQVRLKAVEEYARIRGRADDRPRDQSMGDFRKITTFNQIAGAYERSPLIRAADRTIVLDDAVKSIESNPTDPAAQLRLAYSYIQALDTYQSAVREGELQNLGILGTRLEQWMTSLNRVITNGAFLPENVAKNIARDAKQLSTVIASSRDRKQKEFASRARVSGVGDMWDSFVTGFGGGQPTPTAATPPQRSPAQKIPVGSIVRDKNGQRARVKGFTADGRAILEPVQ